MCLIDPTAVLAMFVILHPVPSPSLWFLVSLKKSTKLGVWVLDWYDFFLNFFSVAQNDVVSVWAFVLSSNFFLFLAIFVFGNRDKSILSLNWNFIKDKFVFSIHPGY